MAYQIIKSEYPDAAYPVTELRPIIEAILDAADDLADLGNNYHPGSMAFVAEPDIPAYMMNASGEWKAV